MSGNYQQSETKSRSFLQLIMFWLTFVTVNIQNVLLWLECGHEDVCATVQCHRQ